MVVSKNSFTKEFQQFVESPSRKQKIQYKSVFDRSKKKQLKSFGIKENNRAFNDSFLSNDFCQCGDDKEEPRDKVDGQVNLEPLDSKNGPQLQIIENFSS